MARQIVRALVYLLAVGFTFLERAFASEGQVVFERKVRLKGEPGFSICIYHFF